MTSFQIDSVSPLALIIVGQPELRATLQMRLFKPITQRLSIRYHLGGMEASEMREYVEHQLQAAGAQHPNRCGNGCHSRLPALYAHLLEEAVNALRFCENLAVGNVLCFLHGCLGFRIVPWLSHFKRQAALHQRLAEKDIHGI